MKSEAVDDPARRNAETATHTPIWDAVVTDREPLPLQHQPSLTDAVAEAVAAGLAELTRLDTIVAEAESRLQQAQVDITAFRAAESKDEDGFAVLLDTVVRDLRDRLGESRRVASTFNVAFFGRTGAGKSTLLSALGGLNGHLVSDGRSDFTVDVQPLDWQGCRLYDTPGINGWGRTRPRPDLEEAAREAVEVADVVLLCFDSQSQQASEFVKVAAWVRDYRKPVVAVLNVRNAMWRHPARVAAIAQRQGLARTAQEHADNITSELESIGLYDVPVVAIHAKRSLFARASTPFSGPAAKELEAERSVYGLDYLNRMSNLLVLEGLLSACILEGAANLRLAALREGLQAGLRDWADEIDGLGQHHRNRGKTIEGIVAEGLNILANADAGSAGDWSWVPPKAATIGPRDLAGAKLVSFWDGFGAGETEFLYQRRRIEPRTGSLLLAPAAFTHTHRGNTPAQGDKYIATSWILFRRAEHIFGG